MNKRLQGFIAGFLVCCFILGTTVFSEGVTKTIKAVFNQVTVKIDGKAVSGDNITYNNNVYVRADKISESLGKAFNWDKKKNTIIINNLNFGNQRDVVTFKNKAIEANVRLILKKQNSSILKSDLQKVTSIYITDTKVSSLDDLKYLENLKELFLCNCQISDITILKDLKKLRTINISGNNVSDITPLSSLNELTNLYLDDNKISDLLPIKQLKKLQKLSFYGNEITDITPLKSLPNLKGNSYLIVDNNNKYFYLGDKFVLIFIIDNKRYLLNPENQSCFIDDSGNVYLRSIISILRVFDKAYSIKPSESPFVDGVLNTDSNKKYITQKKVYLDATKYFNNGEINYHEEKYQYSFNPEGQTGCKILFNQSYFPFTTILKTFKINNSIDLDLKNKYIIFTL